MTSGYTKRIVIGAVIAVLAAGGLAAAVLFIPPLMSGSVGGISAGGSGNLVTFSGQIAVPSGNGAGALTLFLKNGANSPATSVVIAVPTGADMFSDLCTATCNLVMNYGGSPVSASNPLPVGATASGSVQTDEGKAGTAYEVNAKVTFQAGGVQVQNIDITAQLGTIVTTKTGPSMPTVNGQISVPTNKTVGTLSVWVQNTADSSITSIALDPFTATPHPLCAESCPVSFEYNGAIVSSGNPLPIGSIATGSANLNSPNLIAGASYTIAITITYANGVQWTTNLVMDAQP
jgi:hypothetical protein